MNWLYVGLGVAAVVGIGLGGYAAMRSPTFVAGFLKVIAEAVWNVVLPALAKRKTPEEEAKDHQIEREGGKQKDGGR